jgi:methionine-S-sulfoxide reductase
MKIEFATLGGGCFWCLEAVYELLDGVKSVTSGYAGGTADTANYTDVCSGSTEHAEVIQIEFDSAIVSFGEILDIFWTIHDPTTLNRQGNDAGPQYRSVIFFHSEEQKEVAANSIKATATKVWDDPIVTQLEPLEKFYNGESQHQNYYQKTGNRNPYCSFIITPKVTKFRKQFAHKLKQ